MTNESMSRIEVAMSNKRELREVNKLPSEEETRAAELPPEKERETSPSSHLDTARVLANLRGLTLSGGAFSGVSQCIQFCLDFISIVVLARLLSPQDYGLVAMVTALASFLRVFRDAGLSTATVQRENITQAQVSNLFWINAGLGVFATITFGLAAPIIAWFYQEPPLVWVTLALSLTFTLTGLTVQHQALLNRQMRFRTLATVDIGAMTTGILIGIGMAVHKCGYWSLVGMNLGNATMRALLIWSLCKWRPHMPSRRSGVRPLVNFGAFLSMGNFIYSVAGGFDTLLLGRSFGAGAVGLYTRSSAMLMRPFGQILGPMGNLFLPVLSRLQNQPENYRQTFLQLYRAVVLFSFVCTGMFLALAKPLTLLVLGPKWENAAPIFAALTLVAMFLPLSSVCTWLFTTQGRGSDSLRCSVISSLVTVAAFIVGLPFGPVGVALAFGVSGLMIQMPVLYFLAGREGPVRQSHMWREFISLLPVWGVVFCGTFLARKLVWHAGPLTEVLICGLLGFLVVAAFAWVYPPARQILGRLFSLAQEYRLLATNKFSELAEEKPAAADCSTTVAKISNGTNKGKPRILFITPFWPHRATIGSEVRAKLTFEALRAHANVDVVYLKEGVNGSLPDWDSSIGRLSILPIRPHPRVKLIGQLRWYLDPMLAFPWGCGVERHEFAKLYATLDTYDLVWFFKLRSPDMFPITSWPRSVLDIDDVPSTYHRIVRGMGDPLIESVQTIGRHWSWRRREALLGKRFDILGVCSEGDRAYLLQLGVRSPIHVIPNGVPTPIAEPLRNPSKPVRIGFMGLFEYPPNHEGIAWFARECWPRIKAAIPDARLRLAGPDSDGPLKPAGPDIDGLGFIPDPAAEIATWSVCIVPIRRGAGTRVKIAEGFCRKCPIVSTPLGAYGYELGNGEELLLADSADDFSSACIKLIRHPAEATAMAERAWQQFLKQWTWDAIRPRVWAAAEDCLRQNTKR